MKIEQIIDEVYVISDNSKQLLMSNIKEVSLPKGLNILNSDKIERKVYFIKKGIVRAYTIFDGDEVTFWFGQEGNSILSMRSYIEKKASYETIELLEDCVLYEIKMNDLIGLYETNLELANWGRKLAENELIETEERFISSQLGTAIQRYKKLLVENPSLINRVQLGYIASYLGISQVTLSRIRAEI
ncbi:Crp/Fnr family transcriptional regulator [Algoriella sp.]|uniref:Crp/Fnr family transcriptional regulator n=1 Tax=Algoriella sp. TaxID=1872434 RepID=UPI002FC8B30A